ncbi:hypothetical protein AOC36_00480 [Erysipelothrix larvae]|uniref:Cytokinin riboside 5'-monophosphate phosphoribohydrolase n=1 Tax=Erysipelothrix larvae TaxID=1514105 RepID=A0A120JTD2_9FIRM|nr:TIGR00730 family Rossman fold protein [Erysipelothrix larvae]AMC92521.1 hypothetical protein AOC36_00480 [Erysipelothrix larvae]
MKNIAVYLGSRTPSNPIYAQTAKELGKKIAQEHYGLVYGGANVGTMKVLADASLEHQGTVIGVMPTVLFDKEILHPGLSEVVKVADMHQRKKKMMDLSDGFIALPGGCGTMEEIFEVITWRQIGVHNKPFVFLNIDKFYDGLKLYIDHAHELGFISDKDHAQIHFVSTVEEAINAVTTS